MAMSCRQAFKVAFLLRCAEAGLTLDEAHAVIKQGIDVLQHPHEKRALGWLGTLLALGVLPIAAGGAIGGLSGHMLGKAMGGTAETPEDLAGQERIDAYHQATDAARARISQAMQRQAISGVRKSPRRLMV